MAICWCLIPLNSIQRSYSILNSTQTTETILHYSTQFHSKIMLDSTQSNSISLTSTQHCSSTDSFFVYVFITEQRIHEKEISFPICTKLLLYNSYSLYQKKCKNTKPPCLWGIVLNKHASRVFRCYPQQWLFKKMS